MPENPTPNFHEPWKIDDASTYGIWIDGNNGRRVCMVPDILNNKGYTIRIVRCVNFCAGIPDYVLNNSSPIYLLITKWLTNTEDMTVCGMLIDELQALHTDPNTYVPRVDLEANLRGIVRTQLMWNKNNRNNVQEINKLLPDCCKRCDGTGIRRTKLWKEESAEIYTCTDCKGYGHIGV